MNELKEFLKINILKNKLYISIVFIILLIVLLCIESFSLQMQQKNINDKIRIIDSFKNQIESQTSKYKAHEETDASKELAILQSQVDGIDEASGQYISLIDQINQAKIVGVNTDQFQNTLQTIASFLLAQKYTDAATREAELTTDVSNAVTAYKLQKLAVLQAADVRVKLAALQNAQKKAHDALSKEKANISSISGSSITKTNVSGFPVTYLSIDLTNKHLHIISDSANGNECTAECTVTDLMTYYNKNNAFAAVNGGYFCPRSYPDCTRKANSFDFPFYNSRAQRWFNFNNILWIDRAAFTFTDNIPHFYANAAQVSLQPISAGFVMAPGLLENGQIIVQNFPLDAKSATVATLRSAMGIRGNTLIIADISNATVPQSARVMQSLGVTDALELDGGGSTALIYNGQYIIGPGRNIPNAFVFALQ